MYNVAKTFVETALNRYRKHGKRINIAHPNSVCIRDIGEWISEDILSRIHQGCTFSIKNYVIIMNITEDAFKIDGMINGVNEGLENEKEFEVIVTEEEFIAQLYAMLLFYEKKNEKLSVSTLYEDEEYNAKGINEFFRKVRK